MFADREIHIVDSTSASMGEGMLAELGVQMAADGRVRRRRSRPRSSAGGADLQVYLALETLEYLKRGGRISGAQAAIGTLLSVKPIIEIKDGKVETTERVRTRGKAREQLVELLTAAPDGARSRSSTRPTPTSRSSPTRVPRGSGRHRPSKVTIDLVGPSVGPHLGPGCVGAVALYEACPSGPTCGRRRADRRGPAG